MRVVGEGYRPDVDDAVRFYQAALGCGSPHASDSDALASTSLSSSPASSDTEGQLGLGASRAAAGSLAGSGGHGEAPGTIRARRPSLQQHAASPRLAGGSGGTWPRQGADDALQEGPGSGSQPGSASHRAGPRPSLQYEYESQWRSPGEHGGGGSAEATTSPRSFAPGRKRSLGSRGGSAAGSKLPTPGGGVGSAGTAGFMRSSAEFDSAQSLPAAALLAATVEEEAGSSAGQQGPMELVHLGSGWTSVCSWPAACNTSLGTVRGAAAAAEEPGEKRWLVFEVQDTGAGVAARGMDSLFQDYVQVGAGAGAGGGVMRCRAPEHLVHPGGLQGVVGRTLCLLRAAGPRP